MSCDAKSSVDLIVAIVAAFAAIVAAVATWRAATSAEKAAIATKSVATASILSSLMSEYSAPEMHRALEVLSCGTGISKSELSFIGIERVWRNAHPQDSADVNVNDYRRRLHWYVKRAWVLYRNGAIGKEEFNAAVVSTNGYQIWLDVALPLALKEKLGDGTKPDLEWAEQLKSEFPRFLMGKLS